MIDSSQGNSDKANDLSLSFVDVFTNGLGALLVLFFIVAILQTTLEWASATQQGIIADKPVTDPFVILLRAEQDAFEPGLGAWDVPTGNETDHDVGPRYAVLVLEDMPATASRVFIEGISNVAVRCDVYHGRQQIRREYVVPEDKRLCVWPPSDSVVIVREE